MCNMRKSTCFMAISLTNCKSESKPISDRACLEQVANNPQIIAEGCVTHMAPNFLWLE